MMLPSLCLTTQKPTEQKPRTVRLRYGVPMSANHSGDKKESVLKQSAATTWDEAWQTAEQCSGSSCSILVTGANKGRRLAWEPGNRISLHDGADQTQSFEKTC